MISMLDELDSDSANRMVDEKVVALVGKLADSSVV